MCFRIYSNRLARQYKNENPQAIKDYSNQVQSEDKSNQNSNESKDDNGNLTSQVESYHQMQKFTL